MSYDNEVDDKYLIEIKTVQPSNLKGAFSALKDQLSEANITITPEYFEILQMDATHIVIAHLHLKCGNFEKFTCKRNIKIGVDIVNMTKVLKSVGAKDILTFFMEDPQEKILNGDDNPSQSFGLRVENAEKGQVSTLYMDCLDVNEDEIALPPTDYPLNINMPSNDFQQIITSMKNIVGDTIHIRYHKDSLHFFTKGDLGRLEIVRSKTSKEDNSIKVSRTSESESDIIEIYTKLSKMVEFSKCSALSPIVTLAMKNDFPLFLDYDVGSLGFLKLGISPSKRPDEWN